MNDAQQTLLTSSAQGCGKNLVGHTKQFLDSVDWNAVKDVPAFKAAATASLEKTPGPDCLPAAPPGEDVD